MPSQNRNKIYVTLILCVGVIFSVWIYSQTPKASVSNTANVVENDISVRPYIETSSESSDEWKKIITSINQRQPVLNLTNSDSTFDETTITAQVSKDFFSQYLLLKKGGRELTPEDIDNLAKTVTSVPSYTGGSGAVYLPSNLKIVDDTDSNILFYKTSITNTIKNGFIKIQEDPYVITANAIKLDLPQEILKLDPIIAVNKATINDFLNIQVPKEAVGPHLSVLNSLSKILFDIESMRVVFDDPIRGLNGVGQYTVHLTEFVDAINAFSQYLLKN